jgi:hypothetical protein
VRPTKYEPKFCINMLDFFSIDVFSIDKLNRKKLNRFPTFERFAITIGVTHRTLQNWNKEHDDFFRAYEMCKDLQKALIIEGGMTGDYNAAFAKFVAVNVTDLRERIEHEIKQRDIVLSVDSVDARL